MVLFREDIKPNGFNYSTNENKITEFESGHVRVRRTLNRDNIVSVSFLLNQEELTYFDYFYNTEINKGLDTFQANWAGQIELFTIISDYIEVKNNKLNNRLFDVSFTVNYMSEFCDDDRKSLIKSYEKEIKQLQLIDPNFSNTVPCTKDREFLLFQFEEEIKDLRLYDSVSLQFREFIPENPNKMSETECLYRNDELMTALQVELDLLEVI